MTPEGEPVRHHPVAGWDQRFVTAHDLGEFLKRHGLMAPQPHKRPRVLR